MTLAARAQKIYARLQKAYPDARCALNYKNPLQLLVATILSAQCTDVRVNQITPALFKKYRTAADFSKANLKTLEQAIRSAGFYKMKAKAIQGVGKNLTERFGGKVPNKMEDLVTLPGVGRKTANVILGNAYKTPGIVVDTHVRRVSYRLGLTRHTDPEKIEQDLMKLLPKNSWTQFSHCMIFHGRQICKAPKPACLDCPAETLCPKIGVKQISEARRTFPARS